MLGSAVRRAVPDDLAALTAIYNHWVVTSPATFDTEPFAIESRQAWFDEHDDAYPLYVAEDAGDVRGYAHLSRYRERSAYRYTAAVTIYLHEAARGEGIGTALYGVLIPEARRLGYHVLLAGVTVPNPASAGLHRRLGFVSVGVMHEIGWKFDRWHDVEWFELRL